jgi:hypothetical protein
MIILAWSIEVPAAKLRLYADIMGLFGKQPAITCKVWGAPIAELSQVGIRKYFAPKVFLLKLLRFTGIPISMTGLFIRGATKR